MRNKNIRKAGAVFALCCALLFGISMDVHAEAFTEEGNLTLVDDIDEEESESLQYMTVSTKSGATFYIVIDRTASSENVYFLNQVDELDLMAIMDDDQKKEYEELLSKQEVVEEVTVVDETELRDEDKEEVPEVKVEVQPVSPVVYGILAVVAGGVIGGYMFLKKRRKREEASLAEELEFYDDEEYENEDEEKTEEEEDIRR